MKTIIVLLVLLIAVVTVTNIYMMKAEREFLHFCDMVLDDNLKNVVKSGGATFYVVDMVELDIGRKDTGSKFWAPLYVNEIDLETLLQWKRTNAIMVRDFQNLDFDSKMAMQKANAYFQKRLAQVKERKGEDK
jgi:hypothetical protein